MKYRPQATGYLWLILLGIPVVFLLGLYLAPHMGEGLPGIITALQTATEQPFSIRLVENTPRTVLGCLAAYGLIVGVLLSSRRNTRNGEEHGSAKWGSPRAVSRKYREKAYENNLLLTQNVRLGLDSRKHQRNLHVLTVGGSGAVRPGFTANQIYIRPTPPMQFWTPRVN